ncbi:MAG: spondin domain-containing protein [Phycisphaerales bacterium]|nr:spondin domain-containing protein [Phycisphaerales bacterium]
MLRRTCVLTALSCAVIMSAFARADELTITIENTQGTGGFALTPFWFGFHDGSFDVFDAGTSAATLAGVTEIAELGDAGVLAGRFGTEQPSGTQFTAVNGTGAPVFSPGESESFTVDVDGMMNRFFNYAAMVVPSNDLFVGNDLAFELFDAAGAFNGPVTINIYGSNVWDNGSEVNDIANGAAFVLGVDAMLGADEAGTIDVFLDQPGADAYLNSILGTTTADNGSVTTGFTSTTLLGTITIVPAPGAMALLGVIAASARRRRR